MLYGFVGAPCSGKTTSAARIFAELKDLGYPSEFMPEAARIYIAQKKNDIEAGKLSGPFGLADQDQLAIMTWQRNSEVLMNHRGSIVLTDSSVYNTLLYLSPEVSSDEIVLKQIAEAKTRYDIIFRCLPVEASSTMADPNRVHSFEESCELNRKLNNVLALHDIETVTLDGNTRQRCTQAINSILETLLR